MSDLKQASSMFRDPVCGMTVSPESEIRCRYRGVTYGFCCEHCLNQFSRHPDYYLGGGSRKVAHAADQAAVYTCPMHLDVRQAEPGDCPKCGMALEPEGVPSTAEAENPELAAMSRRFWLCLMLTLPVFVLAMSTHVGLLHHGFPLRLEQCFEGALATPVVFWGGWPLLVRGWN